jgi:ATP synthase protein I
MAEDVRPQPANAARTREQFAAMLRGSLVPTLVVGVLAVVLAAVLGGAEPATSAALGAALVVVFFSLSLLVMRQTAHLQPTAVMAVVLATYTGKILALGIVMIVLRDAAWLSGQALALSIIVCTVVWLAFEMRAFTRMRVLVAPEADGEDQS